MIVRKLRLQRGWSQEQLAELSGLSVRTIQRAERGAKPGLETAKSLASVFELELSTFTGGDTDMTDKNELLEERTDTAEKETLRSLKFPKPGTQFYYPRWFAARGCFLSRQERFRVGLQQVLPGRPVYQA